MYRPARENFQQEEISGKVVNYGAEKMGYPPINVCTTQCRGGARVFAEVGVGEKISVANLCACVTQGVFYVPRPYLTT